MTDVAGNTATASVAVNIDKTPPSVKPVLSPAPNEAGWNRQDVTVRFEGQDALSGVATVSPSRVVSTEGAGQTAEGTATDRAGNTATATATVNLDKTAPLVAVTEPPPGTIRRLPRADVSGMVTDANPIASISVNGASAGTGSPFRATAPLSIEGTVPIVVSARDIAGNEGTAITSVIYQSPPVVKITSPLDLAAFGRTPLTLSGTVDDPQATVIGSGGPRYREWQHLHGHGSAAP